MPAPIPFLPVVPTAASPARPDGIPGRGASSNPHNRFARCAHAPDEEWSTAEDPGPGTVLMDDTASSLITRNDSPDIGFAASINPYRGCEHGCIYCYARPSHEYLGLSAGLDFESRILVKREAAQLLRAELARPQYAVEELAMSTVTDCYQPAERRLLLTRGCLAVLAELRHPVAVITKSQLVVRDADLLQELARVQAVSVTISLTTLSQELSLAMEPRAAVPAARLNAIRILAAAGIPVGVNLAPIIPGLTDHEIPALLRAAAGAGARFAGYTLVRLPHAVAGLFTTWLAEHRPLAQGRILGRIRQLRGGLLNDPRFGTRMRGEGVFAEQIGDLFQVARRRLGLGGHPPELSRASFRPPGGVQLSWFDR
jgi:DNA repair photolyase